MFGLFTRPPRRPRTVRRTPARSALRVEALETRCTPSISVMQPQLLSQNISLAMATLSAAGQPSTVTLSTSPSPVIQNITANWQDPYDVVVSGVVTGPNVSGATVTVTGTGTPAITVPVNGDGSFSIQIKDGDSSPIYIQAQDNMGNCSGMVACVYGGPTYLGASNAGAPVITNVTVTCEGGTWHIRGQILNSTPLATILQVSSTIPGMDGRPTTVINPDGSFDIAITLDADSPGGSFSITAINNDTGQSSQEWDGTIG
jgi:Bacterial Ig domain